MNENNYVDDVQKNQILNMLVNADKKGVYNYEMVEVSLRYSGVLIVLRDAGHDIETIHESGRIYKYVYISAPTSKPKKIKRADETVFEAVSGVGSVTAEELEQLLNHKGIEFKWKTGMRPRR